MKKGTYVGLDENFKNVCVGDQIKDADGYIYTIDRYGKAVGKGGSSFQLSEIEPFELYRRGYEVKATKTTIIEL